MRVRVPSSVVAAVALVVCALAAGCTDSPTSPPNSAPFSTTDLRVGTGAEAVNGSTLTVHYTGWTTDGKMFDTSLDKGQPITFGLGDVISGWTEGLQLMTVGEKMRFWIPEKLAYKGERPPRGMLVFDVELISFK